MDFTAIDTLDFAHVADLRGAHARLAPLLRSAEAVVAHSSAASIVLEALASERLMTPVLLLSPLIVIRKTLGVRSARALLRWPPISRALNAYAGRKLSLLSRERAYVLRQLRLLVGERFCSDALIDEAQTRIRDSRSQRIAERTAEFLRFSMMPLSEAARDILAGATVLVGTGLFDRKMARRVHATVLAEVVGAPMLETPQSVAAALDRLLNQAQPARTNATKI